EEGSNQCDGFSRPFLHDPVSRTRDYPARHMCSYQAKSVRHRRAIGFLRADSEDRHGQHALCEKGPVVDSILRERDELREGIMNGVRPRVELGIVLAGLFVDAGGGGRWLGSKTVEMSARQTCHPARLGQ